MVKPEIYVPHHSELDSSFEAIGAPRPLFVRAQSSIEKLIVLARTMTPSAEQGDWGSWNYHHSFGKGSLFVPFGENGIAGTFVQCTGDIGSDDIAQSIFSAATTTWRTPHYAYAALALPDNIYRRDINREPDNRLYFFYQEAAGVLRLEEFGSKSAGWFASRIGNIHSLEVSFNYTNVRIALDPKMLEDDLQFKKYHGSVTPVRLEQVSR